MDHETLVRFVREDCGGNVKAAADQLGVSVSFILAAATELRTQAQMSFDERIARKR